MSEPTPMMRQYLELKNRYPGMILFFRLGDFYEMFNEDAELASRELDITLTARHKNTENPIPMCGVPHHAAASYIAKLVRKGHRVAICEQTEESTPTTKLVKRDVVRVITPGTAIDEQLLERTEPVYLACLSGSGGSYGLAYLELSTGEFSVIGFSGPDAWSSLVSDLETIAPNELLYPGSLAKIVEHEYGKSDFDARQSGLFEPDSASRTTLFTTTQLADSKYDTVLAADVLNKQFETRDLSGFGLDKQTEAVRAAGACLGYALETQKDAVMHIKGIELIETSDHLILDALTIRNLELVRGADETRKKSLIGVIDETVTPMGARTLRAWLLRPSVKISEINSRKTAVRAFTDTMLRDQTRFHLKNIADLERLVGRISLGTANPRDLNAIAESLGEVPSIRGFLSDTTSPLLHVLLTNISELRPIHELITAALNDDPPVNISDGGFIRDGYDSELDEFRAISRDAKQTVALFEQREKEETEIQSLRIKFNNVFGYFIEISKANLAKAPEHYERRQTLANSERFTTPELKDLETKILGAEESIKTIETKLFRELIRAIAGETRTLQKTAHALAVLDVLASFAESAVRRDYVEPEVHDGDELMVKNGRHPVVEALSNDPFIPNDLSMNNSTDRMLIITGANMGGKSTLLRQVALIQILAQIGSFVPASVARIPIADRVWTRVGASDDLASGRSTFMVEMTETALILHNATPKSLVLLDEIGRGTSTFDGLAIAWSVAEYLHDSPKHSAKTLFATHYHELTELAEKLKGAKNYRISAKEIDGKVVFLHKLEAGKASKSYGIAVARLAGLPAETIERAKAVLKTLEQYELAVFSEGVDARVQKGLPAAASQVSGSAAAAQVSLFAISNESLIDELRDTDIELLSKEESAAFLKRLKDRII